MLSAINRYDQALALADVSYVALNLVTGERTTNGVMERIVGLPPVAPGASFDVSAWLARMHPDDAELLSHRWRQLLASEISSYSLKYRIRPVSDGWRLLQLRVNVSERTASGEPLWVTSVTTDVTTEWGLDRRFHALFERPFQYIAILRKDGLMLETNRVWASYADTQAVNETGRFWDIPLLSRDPQLKTRMREAIKAAAAGKTVRFELPFVGAQGGSGALDFTLTPTPDVDGSISTLIAEARDISEVVHLRDSLRQNKTRIELATTCGEIGMWESVFKTGALWMNDQCYTQLGYEPGEFPAHRDALINLLHVDDQEKFSKAVRAMVERRSRRMRVETRMRNKSGNWQYVLHVAQVADVDEHGEVSSLAGIQLDVTQQHELEMQLASSQRLESIGTLAAGIAHEINTPIQYVGDSLHFIREAMLELVQMVESVAPGNPLLAAKADDLAYLRENLPPSMERAVEGLERVAEIVRSIKEFSHPEQKQMQPVDINRAIATTLVVARTEYKYVADIKTELADLPLVTCQGGEINQVILNLIVNAAHAIGDVVKGTDQRGCITIRTVAGDGSVIISISDTGCGIPERIREHIFDPFFTTKEVGKGTGQGLSIARNIIVRRHGGSLTFTTESGVGTTFFIELPVASVVAAEIEAAA